MLCFMQTTKNQTLLQNVETDFQHYSFGEELFDSAQHFTQRQSHGIHIIHISETPIKMAGL